MRSIVEDLEETLGSGIAWPSHPLDEESDPPAQHKSLYLGAAGTLCAMSYLEQQGAVGLRVKPSDLIGRAYESYLAKPDTGDVVPSYFLGEVGILLVLWRLTQSREAADRLKTCIEQNIANPTNEALWGAPGTMVGAWHMYQWTGEQRWRDLFLANADAVWRTLYCPAKNATATCGPRIFRTQDLYGRVEAMLGAGHGFAGNAYPLLRGAALLSAEWREALYDRCAETLGATALVEG